MHDMSKIYSRPRLRLPKFIYYKRKPSINNYNRKKNYKHKKLVLVMVIAFVTLKIVLDTINPVFNKLCENKALSLSTIISNNKATEVMKNHTYDELFTIEKDENGNVTMIKANVVPINEITSDIAVKIQEEINKEGRDNIEIAIRNFYRNKIFFRKRARGKIYNINCWKCKNGFKKRIYITRNKPNFAQSIFAS